MIRFSMQLQGAVQYSTVHYSTVPLSIIYSAVDSLQFHTLDTLRYDNILNLSPTSYVYVLHGSDYFFLRHIKLSLSVSLSTSPNMHVFLTIYTFLILDSSLQIYML